jgi:hypothetical protein
MNAMGASFTASAADAHPVQEIKGDATLKVKIKWWIQHLTAPLERIFT